MVYIIIAIVAFFVLKKLISAILHGTASAVRNLFFHPQVNSAVTIFFVACFLISGSSPFGAGFLPLLRILWALCILDCIRDILVGDSYYKAGNAGVDPLYATKSVLSIFTLGLVRGVFFLVVGPYLHRSEAQALRETVASGLPVSPYCGSGLRAREYYYDQELEKLVQSGEIVSNEHTLRTECALIKKKLDQLYPKKFLEVAMDAIRGDPEVKRDRAKGKQVLEELDSARVYLGKAAFERLGEAVKEAMKDKAPMSADDIVRLKALQPFGLVDRNGRSGWGQLFVIQALGPMVENGTFVDLDLSDKPWDNHAYQYAKSTKPMASLDAGGDPRFYDPDLCD